MDISLRNRIADLLSQIDEDTVYFNYNSLAFGLCRMNHWQAKMYVKHKLSTKNRSAPFLEPLDQLWVMIGPKLKTPLIDALLDCFGDYVVPSGISKKSHKMITPLRSPVTVSMEDVVGCLILWCIATDMDCAIDKLESFSNNDPLKYKEYVMIEGLNISENYNFSDFEMIPSNENLGVIPESLIKQLGYPFWPDRTLLVFENEFNKAIEKPKVVSKDEFRIMVGNNRRFAYNFHINEKTGKVYTNKRSFKTEKKRKIRIVILCFAFSLHLKTPISYSWHFLSLDENHLLYILPNAKFRPIEGNVDHVLGRTNKISIPDNDMAEIKRIYEQTVAIDNIGSEESKDFMDCVKLFMDLQTLPMRLDYNKVPMLSILIDTSLEKDKSADTKKAILNDFVSSVDASDSPLNKFYKLRNGVVHAIKDRKNRLRDVHNNEKVDKLVEETVDFLREMLKKCIDEQVMPSVDNKQRNI